MAGEQRPEKQGGRSITLLSCAFNLPVMALMLTAQLRPAAAIAVAAVMSVLNGWLLYIGRREWSR